jgi:hypothetical protein
MSGTTSTWRDSMPSPPTSARSRFDGRATRWNEMARSDREHAIGLLLHNCYGAMEAVLERLQVAIDGEKPIGGDYHKELVRRAARPVPGLRPAIISRRTAEELNELRKFRHVLRHAYDEYDYAKVAPNVPLAKELVARFEADVLTFARQMGAKRAD